MKLGCYLGFYSEIRTVSLILGLGSSLVSRFHSFLLSLDPDPVKSFTSSSLSSSQNPASVIVLSLLPLVTNLVLELQRKWFDDEDSAMNLWELLRISLHLDWIWFWNFRVCSSCSSIFLSLLQFDLTDMREKISELFLMWPSFFWFLWHPWPYIGWHVDWVGLRGIFGINLQIW